MKDGGTHTKNNESRTEFVDDFKDRNNVSIFQTDFFGKMKSSKFKNLKQSKLEQFRRERPNIRDDNLGQNVTDKAVKVLTPTKDMYEQKG